MNVEVGAEWKGGMGGRLVYSVSRAAQGIQIIIGFGNPVSARAVARADKMKSGANRGGERKSADGLVFISSGQFVESTSCVY